MTCLQCERGIYHHLNCLWEELENDCNTFSYENAVRLMSANCTVRTKSIRVLGKRNQSAGPGRLATDLSFWGIARLSTAAQSFIRANPLWFHSSSFIKVTVINCVCDFTLTTPTAALWQQLSLYIPGGGPVVLTSKYSESKDFPESMSTQFTHIWSLNKVPTASTHWDWIESD